uniref:Elongation of very long chain fatty acids protein n=1 Tax=Timema shepardi TaxID=629360 RepID=A0A7R9FWN7_TIMSH|nr:unnamed protein product [Timema shepardi]
MINPRVNQWSMMTSPFPTLAICLAYAYFAKVLGPRLMENRKPFNLRNVLIVYNFLQTIFSSWIFYEYLASGWAGHYSFRCQPVDYSNNPMALRMARTCWWYYFSKFTEFLDTLFFILRKKNTQVSNLHVIHHGCMPMSVWLGMKWSQHVLCFVEHICSHHHVFLLHDVCHGSTVPEISLVEEVQFVLIFGHQFQLLFTECNYPKGFMVWIGLHGVLFLFLFSDFYKAKYGGRKASSHNGACMPVLDEKKVDDNGNGVIARNGVVTNGNGHLISSDYSNLYTKTYSSCYSNGINNGYVSTATILVALILKLPH